MDIKLIDDLKKFAEITTGRDQLTVEMLEQRIAEMAGKVSEETLHDLKEGVRLLKLRVDIPPDEKEADPIVSYYEWNLFLLAYSQFPLLTVPDFYDYSRFKETKPGLCQKIAEKEAQLNTLTRERRPARFLDILRILVQLIVLIGSARFDYEPMEIELEPSMMAVLVTHPTRGKFWFTWEADFRPPDNLTVYDYEDIRALIDKDPSTPMQ